jgi:hypothetical protein
VIKLGGEFLERAGLKRGRATGEGATYLDGDPTYQSKLWLPPSLR